MTERISDTRVYIALSNTGAWYLDSSTLDGDDPLTDGFYPAFTGAHDEVTDDVDGPVTIKFGTDDLIGAVQAGELDFRLQRPSNPGYWNPNNPSSPIYRGTLSPGFDAMRAVKVVSTINGTDYTECVMFIRRATYRVQDRYCDVHCEDLLLWLSRVFPVIGALTATTTGAAIQAILEAAGQGDPAWYSLDVGDSIASWPGGDGTKSALQLIADLLTAERGTFWIARTGVATYRARSYALLHGSVATFSTQPLDMDSGVDADKVYNRARVTDAGGVEQTADDVASQQSYGVVEYPALSSTLIPDGNGAALAADIVYEAAGGKPPVLITAENDDGTVLLEQVTTGLLDTVTASETLSGTAGDYVVQQITHTIDVQGWYRQTMYRADARAASVFALDSSGLDGPDELRY